MLNIFKGKKSNIDIKIKRQLLKDAIKFKIIKIEDGQEEIIKFPIEYMRYFSNEEIYKKEFYTQLQILNSLWDSEEIKEKEDGSYLLSVEKIYDYEDDLLNLLGLKSGEDLEVKIDNQGAIGSSNFSLKYVVRSKEYGYLNNFYDRIGPFFPYKTDKAYLLSEELREVLDLIDNPPKNREDQPEYFAKVKTKAKKLNIDLSFNNYLEKEEYYFPEKLDVEISDIAIDQIELNPLFTELDDFLNMETGLAIEKGRNYTVSKKDGENKRVFVSPEKKNDYEKVIKNRELKGAEVPDFVDNPFKYLPESIDLEKFSERVKGLKERIYKAQPFVHTKSTDDIDWFEIDLGIKLKGEDEDGSEEEIEMSEYEKLVKEAKDNGEEYILWEGKWIKITDSSEEFITKNQEVENLKEEGRINRNKLSYIFDIYENVDLLEYNKDMLDYRESLREDGALEFRQPELFKGKLHDYQEYGYVWLNKLRAFNLGGLLADDMGLGKTIQVIALMASLKEDSQLSPSLVVAPKSLLENWESEINKFCPDIDKIYYHMGSSRNKNSKVIKKSEVVLTTYSTLVSDQVLLGEIDWSLMVCDEVQDIRNHSTLKAHAVKAQKAKIRLGLSGTPVQNTVADLWSIYDFAQPGLLDSFKDFKERYVKPIENSETPEEFQKYEEDLKGKIKPVFLRRTKEGELKHMLPDKNDKRWPIEMSDYQFDKYRDIIQTEMNTEGRTHLKTLQQLIQVCSHPALVNNEWNYKDVSELIQEGPKLKATLDILAEVKNKNEKALIFTFYRDMQLILERVIRVKFNLEHIPIINGDSKRRLRSVDHFNDKEGFGCMILSPKAAGTGLNITGANHVIHYTRWWNPAVEQQATDRVYRIGQEKDVTVYYPIMTSQSLETVEEKLARLLEEKKYVANSIVVPNKPINNELVSAMNEDYK